MNAHGRKRPCPSPNYQERYGIAWTRELTFLWCRWACSYHEKSLYRLLFRLLRLLQGQALD